MPLVTELTSLQTRNMTADRMKALVYHGPGKRAWAERSPH